MQQEHIDSNEIHLFEEPERETVSFFDTMDYINAAIADRERRLDELMARLLTTQQGPVMPAAEGGVQVPTALMDYDLVRHVMADAIAETANVVGALMNLQRRAISLQLDALEPTKLTEYNGIKI